MWHYVTFQYYFPLIRIKFLGIMTIFIRTSWMHLYLRCLYCILIWIFQNFTMNKLLVSMNKLEAVSVVACIKRPQPSWVRSSMSFKFFRCDLPWSAYLTVKFKEGAVFPPILRVTTTFLAEQVGKTALFKIARPIRKIPPKIFKSRFTKAEDIDRRVRDI